MLSKGKVATRLPPTTLIGRGHSIPRNSGSTRSKIAKVDCATSAQVASGSHLLTTTPGQGRLPPAY
jgi:hypothetical protein